MRFVRTISLLFALGCTGGAHAQDAPSYDVRLDANGDGVAVRLCLDQAHEKVEFAADSDDAMKYLHDVRREQEGLLAAAADRWNAKDWRVGECLEYHVDLDAITAAHDTDIGWRLGDDRAAAPQLLLLRPDVQGDVDAKAQVSLPEGWSFSAPWHRLGHTETGVRYDIPNTPPNWSANVAFGHFTEQRMELPGGTLRVSILHGPDAEQEQTLHVWLDRVTRAVLSAYGRLPLADVQVLVIPLHSHRGAVMFGQSIRGQGNALEILVDASRPAAEFDDDWIAVHELSHLMHPYLGDRGSWVAEGLATYYQNVLRARGGMLTAAQGWDRLREGFSRNDGKRYDETLADAAGTMHRTHDFQRIYWSGAAFWLTVDRDLRHDSGGRLGLDLALSRFRDCCLPAYRGWAPEEFVAKLDALLEVRTFSTRYREFSALRRFPEWKSVFDNLGIRDGGEHLHFDVAARDARVRDAIMAPRPE
jgi:hypothetical protein